MPDVVLIGGCPRSGTTLFAELLNTSPAVGIIFEYSLGELVRDLAPIFAYETIAVSQRETRRRAVDAAGADPAVYVNVEQLVERPSYPSKANLPQIVRKIVSASLDKGELAVIGSKTPGSDAHALRAPLEPYFSAIDEFFLVRNPADTINSMINRRNRTRLANDGWIIADVERAIDEYRASLRLLLSRAVRDPDRTWVVKYEDIVQRPQWLADWIAVTLGIAPIALDSEAARAALRPASATKDVLTDGERERLEATFAAAIATWPAKILTGRAYECYVALADCVDKASPDETYAFGKSNRRRFLGLGWGEAEPEGVWSDGDRAHLFWSIERAGNYDLVFDVEYFLPDPRRELTVAIVLDNAPVYEKHASTSEAKRPVIVEALALEAGAVHCCTINIAGACSPAELGLSADERKLGIFLRSLRLRAR